MQSKKASYLKSEIHSEGSNASHVWRTVDNLLSEDKSEAKSNCSPEDYHSYFDKKVVIAAEHSELDSFSMVSIEYVIMTV